jgi:TatD DNase family protein
MHPWFPIITESSLLETPPPEPGNSKLIMTLIDTHAHLDFPQFAGDLDHLELAAAAGKSVVIHQRDSWEDTIEILRKYSTRVRAVIHCFDAGLAQVQEVVDLGHFVSFSGIVTFENASEVREAAKSVPIERIMVETDAPYFAPAPNRTKRCEPAFIRETAAFIANLRGMSLAAFAAQTTQNAQGFFEFNT